MFLVRKIAGAIAFLALISLAATANAQNRDVMLVLDASNSMWGQIDGQNKIVIARDVVRDVLGQAPSDMRLGVLAYGHRREGDCGDIETVIPVGEIDADRYMGVIDSIKPRGKTPLTEAVRQAAEQLRYADVPATVILVSDGIETCNADPCALADALAAGGVDFKVHVVGFDVTAEEAASFSCLAEKTGGRMFQARDAGELTTALDTAVQEIAAAPEPAKESDPEPQAEPEPVHEGPNLQLSAVPAEGMEPLTAGPYWIVYEPEADDNGKRREVKRSGSAIARLELPAGRYFVEVIFDKTAVSREIEVPEDALADEVFVLGAGRLTAVAVPSEGAEPFNEAYWILYSTEKDLDGKRKEIGRDGSADADFFVPAGTYWLEGQYKSAKGGMEVSVEAGKLTESTLVLGAGVLVVTATAVEGSEPLDHTMFIVYEAKTDLSGKRKEIARSARDIAEFGLPAGDYLVVAQSGKAEAASEVSVAANQRAERAIVLNLGALKLTTTVAGLSGPMPRVPFRYEVASATKDLSGKRKQIVASAKAEPVLRLPAGDYHVTARLGSQNVVSQADVSVPAGQLTETAIEQQAGFVNFTVEKPAQGRTWFEVYDSAGNKVAATVSAKVSYVLAPGAYEARLHVDDAVTVQPFSVASGGASDMRLSPNN